MGWFEGVLFVYCTASLAVGNNEKSGSKNVKLSNTHITNERFSTFPRRNLPFRNDTSTSETVRTTSGVSISTLYTSTAVESFTMSKSESSAPSTVIIHDIVSSHKPDTTIRFSALNSGIPIGGSNNAPAITSTMSESATASRTITEEQQSSASSSISLFKPKKTSTSSHSSSSSSETASSMRASSTVKELPVTSDARSTANNPILSTVWVNADSSSIQPPNKTFSVVISSQSTLSTSLPLSNSHDDLQRNTQSSTSSLVVSAAETQRSLTTASLSGTSFSLLSSSQKDALSKTRTEMTSMVIPPTQTSLSLSWTPVADATAITSSASIPSDFSRIRTKSTSSLASPSSTTKDSASRNHTLPLPTPSYAPTTAAELPQHSVSCLTNWIVSGYGAIIDVSSVTSIALSSAATTGVATPTSVTSQPAQSAASAGSTSLPLDRNDTMSGTSPAAQSISLRLESSMVSLSPTLSFASRSVSQTTGLSGSTSLVNSTVSIGAEPTPSSAPTNVAENDTNLTSTSVPIQSGSSRVNSSTLDSSVTISALATLVETTSPTLILTDTIIANVSDITIQAVAVTSITLQAIGSTAQFAQGNRTVSSSVALVTTFLGTSSLLSTTASESSFSTAGTPSISSPIPSSLMQTLASSTTSHIFSATSPVQTTAISNAPTESSDTLTMASTTASRTVTTWSTFSWPRPSLSTALVGSASNSLSSATEYTFTSSGSATATDAISSAHPSISSNLHLMPGPGSISSTATSAISSIPASTSSSPTSTGSIPKSTRSFVTNIRTKNSKLSLRTSTASDGIYDATKGTQSTVHTPTSSATETVIVAAPSPLTPSQTAGVALGSTAGVLLAIVAAIFVARRYHAMHAAKRGSGGSSGIYPKVAYLYDPSLGENGDLGSTDETLAFMSGGAGGLPSTRSRTPRAPQNSFDYNPHNWCNFNGLQYSDPDNQFRDPEDLFLDRRSSDAIGSPSDTVSALAAAVAEYGAGPQRPLPPVPDALTPLFRDHVIPSPTLGPITNGCSLRRSHARSSRGSSVRSQRSLRNLRTCLPANPTPKDHPPSLRGPRQSLSPINEGHVNEPFLDPIEHDLLLPVDVRTETPDSVMVYAPVPRSPIQPALSTILSEDQRSMTSSPSIVARKALAAAQPRSTEGILFPATKDDQYSYMSFVHNNALSPSHPERTNGDQTITQLNNFIPPSPPAPTSALVPRNKGWEEIKRTSNGSSSLHSPLPTPPLHSFAPLRLNLSPPPPLKKCSLIRLRRRTPLAGTGQPIVSTHNLPSSPSSSPLVVKPSFTFNSNKSFEGPRMSLLAKVNSIGDTKDEAASSRRKIGRRLGYRDSISRRVETRSRWSPSEVGRTF